MLLIDVIANAGMQKTYRLNPKNFQANGITKIDNNEIRLNMRNCSEYFLS